MTGPRSKITVLDYDSTDQGGFGDALSRHGDTPIKVQTASGKLHGLYRHNGERRCVRPFEGLPVDILGAGFVVAAGSVIPGMGVYEFIEGGLDDLDRLPALRGLPSSVYAKPTLKPEAIFPDGIVPDGERNTSLFSFCMKEVAKTRGCGTEEERLELLIKEAVDFNARCEPPLSERRVMTTVASAWGYEQRGDNWFGSGSWRPLPREEALQMILKEADAFRLCCFLQLHQSHDSEFMIANGLADVLGWTLRRLREARKVLIERGLVVRTKGYSNFTGAALYRWG
jgi:hypothetical protein